MPIRGPHTHISTDPIFIQKDIACFFFVGWTSSYCLLLAGKFIGYVKYLNADGFADFDRLVATSGYFLLLFFRWNIHVLLFLYRTAKLRCRIPDRRDYLQSDWPDRTGGRPLPVAANDHVGSLSPLSSDSPSPPTPQCPGMDGWKEGNMDGWMGEGRRERDAFLVTCEMK